MHRLQQPPPKPYGTPAANQRDHRGVLGSEVGAAEADVVSADQTRSLRTTSEVVHLTARRIRQQPPSGGQEVETSADSQILLFGVLRELKRK